MYACSDTSQQHIQDIIKKKRLNRLVVASCSPRTHEILFQETLRESGLNQYLFAMTNIRDQCSWVHRDDPKAATDKAVDLMRMAVARARQLKALGTGRLPVTQSALVLGGGLAGMTAALAIADQGFPVTLVEKESALGGQLRQLHYTLERADVPKFLLEIVSRVESHPKINLELESSLKSITGHVGNFTATVLARGEEKTIKHGVVILATGGQERQTEQYHYGQNKRVMTQRELEHELANGQLPKQGSQVASPTIVMIQCVDSRDEKHPYCSRVCCGQAIKNALAIKEINPDAKVIVLFKDIRTYGFRETYYEEARRAGVLFIRHPQDDPPKLENGKGLRVTVTDTSTSQALTFKADLWYSQPASRLRPTTPSTRACCARHSPPTAFSWKPTRSFAR